jgi:hypothetical protein
MKDMLECDRRADDAKKSDVVPPSSLQQQSVIASQAHALRGGRASHISNARTLLVCSCSVCRSVATRLCLGLQR